MCNIVPTNESPSSKTVYVFVNRGFPVGGIESMVVRLAELLLATGCPVIVTGEASAMSQMLPREVVFFESGDDFLSGWTLSRFLARAYSQHEVVLISLHPWSLVLCFVMRYLLIWEGLKRFRGFHFVSSSRAFFFSDSRVANRLLEQVFARAPRAATFFMNDAAREAHQAYWGKDLHDYPILRIPTESAEVQWRPRARDTLRIVSVGRLVPFKAYNRSAPSIVRRLIDLGHSVEWDIWGHGEDTELVRSSIEALNVGAAVKLRGSLAYEELNRTIAEYDVFVGLGTSILEAAQAGMPSICALDQEGELSYGFLFEAPSDSVGDKVEGAIAVPVIDKLTQIIGMSLAERREVGLKCSQNVRQRSASLADFATAIKESSAWPIRTDLQSRLLALKSLFLLGFREVYLRLKFAPRTE